jgi:hypothetical protein
MKRSEAPQPGWYPDPAGGSRLRWWEGDDWSDRFRARPPDMRQVPAGQMTPGQGSWSSQMPHGNLGQLAQQAGQYAQQYGHIDSAHLVEQMRSAARAEVDRAAQLFRVETQQAVRKITPLVTEYTSKVTRFVKLAFTIVFVLGIGWVAFQLFAQQSLFEWIGDRIDQITENLNDENAGLLPCSPGTPFKLCLTQLERAGR